MNIQCAQNVHKIDTSCIQIHNTFITFYEWNRIHTSGKVGIEPTNLYEYKVSIFPQHIVSLINSDVKA